MTSGAISIVQRGGRIRKRGKHVVTFSAAMGVTLHGAAALALGGALSLALPLAALAEECGAMSGGAGGGTVVCNVETYTGDGGDAADNAGATRIFYSGTWTQDATIIVDGLFLTTGPSAVRLETDTDSGGVTSSIIVNGGAISTTELLFRPGISIRG